MLLIRSHIYEIKLLYTDYNIKSVNAIERNSIGYTLDVSYNRITIKIAIFIKFPSNNIEKQFSFQNVYY